VAARRETGALPPRRPFGPAPPGHSSGEDAVTFFFPGGFLTNRKPLAETLEAFRRTDERRLRLLVKAQIDPRWRRWRDPRSRLLRRAARADRRIELMLADLPNEQHLRSFAGCDVCLAPSRWEGLGLHLFEATAFGMPIITNDAPPMNEIVHDGLNGLLVRSPQSGHASSGIPAVDPDLDDLARAIERLADPELRGRLSDGARRVREERSWSRTVSELGSLLESPARAVAQ
jgi:glycosyltransferase involved in cell wall biosynthesis